MSESQGRQSQRRDSQSTLSSLLQLDPSPMDSPSVERDADSLEALEVEDELRSLESSSASTIRPGSTTAPGLSGSGRGAIYYCTCSRPPAAYEATARRPSV
jgi:hypothetical protein